MWVWGQVGSVGGWDGTGWDRAAGPHLQLPQGALQGSALGWVLLVGVVGVGVQL